MKLLSRLTLITIVAAVTLVLFSAVALADGEWITTREGINVWNPNPVSGEFITWTGDCDPESYATGYGILRWFVNGKLEQTYQGKMLKGKLHGKGAYKWIDGMCYEGDFVNNEFTGKGVLSIPKVGLYEGDFSDGKMQGKGTLRFINGNMYEGEVADDKFQGKGLYRWIDGSSYQGDFVAGARTGQGVYTFPDSSRYEGDFLNGVFHGSGILYNPYGDIEKQGHWENGKFTE